MEIQTFDYLKNEKSFLDEIKNIFNSVWRSIIWCKVKICYKIADASFSTNPTKWSNSVSKTSFVKGSLKMVLLIENLIFILVSDS